MFDERRSCRPLPSRAGAALGAGAVPPYQEACVAVRPQHAPTGTGAVPEVAKVTLTASASRTESSLSDFVAAPATK